MPRRDRDTIEQEMVDRKLTGLRVTKGMVDVEIKGVLYHHFPDTTVTVCLLTLQNEFTVVGSSACADPTNFREDLGQKLAFDDARDKIWQLLGFRLRDQIQAAVDLELVTFEPAAEGGGKDD